MMMMTVMEVMELPPLSGRALYRLMDDPIDSTPQDIRAELHDKYTQMELIALGLIST
jgi:hypothetical protein